MPALVPELTVSDWRASRAFYCDLLGFAERYARPEEGFVYLALGKAEIMLDQRGLSRDWETGPLERPFGRGINFQIKVEAIDPVLARLAAAGLALFQPVETRTYDIGGSAVTQRQFCVLDPDGYLLRFFEVLG